MMRADREDGAVHGGPAQAFLATRLPLVSAALLIVFLFIGHLSGESARRFVNEQQTITVTGPLEGYRAFRDAGVTGRVVVLLDTQVRIVPRVYDRPFMAALDDDALVPPFEPLNFAGGLIQTGIARAVYFVPSPAARADAIERFGGRWDSWSGTDSIELRYCGAPVHVVLGDLEVADLDEKVIVYAVQGALDGYDPAFVEEITSATVADVVIMQASR